MPQFPTEKQARRLGVAGIRLLVIGLFLQISLSVHGQAWPVREPFSIGGLFQDFQNYASIPYFHGGVDLRVPAGTPVYAPVKGRVRLSRYRIDASNAPRRFVYYREPFRSPAPGQQRSNNDRNRYLEISLTDEAGRNWMIRHIDPDSVPQKIRFFATTSEVLPAGSHLGNVIAWHIPVTPRKETYDHIHFEVTDAPGNYLNPLLLLPPRPDLLPPQIGGIWFCPNEREKAFPTYTGVPRISGNVDIIAEIADYVDNLGYLVAPHRVKYTIDRETDIRRCV